ncbi:MAG: hypothetical protein J0I06_22690 [Planctomycetes bacterium]|nr:hypothetical protein [Planctomycetota bacterium]
MSRIKAVLLLCGALLAVPALGASPDPKDLAVSPEELSKARDLVRRLGSEFYREREDAQAALTKMGRAARQALVEGAGSDPDPEIRQRCARLLPRASSDDLKARIDTFLADTEGKYDHDLPGLKTFRKSVGSTEKARALYVEILKSPYNLDMFAAIDRGENEGGRAISDRRTAMWNDLQQRPAFNGRPFVPRQPSLPDIAALLFAETIVPSDHIPKTGIWTWVNGAQFVQQNASMQAINGGSVPHADIYKEIVARWLATRTDPQELTNLAYQLGNTNLRQFKESHLLLRRVVLTDGVQGYAKGQALNSLLQNRVKEELPFLRAILKNQLRVGDYPGVLPDKKNPDTIISLNNDQLIQQVWFNRPTGQAEMHSCLMKDVALAYLIVQGGGKLQDYGFETPQGAINTNQLGFGQYAFTSEEKRTAGFVKYGWKQLKDAVDPPKEAPKEPKPEAPMPTVPPPK